MTHLRLICPAVYVERVLVYLQASGSCVNVVRIPGTAVKPGGDLILCDVAREDASRVIAELEKIGLCDGGSIAVEEVDASVGDGAREAEVAAPGSPADAVVWETLESQTQEITRLSGSFLVLIIAATLIAAAGIMTDSIILIIGAMVVGPEFGPLAAVAVGVVRKDRRLVRESLTALAVGFPVAIAASWAGTLGARGVGLAPASLDENSHQATLFISHPNWWSVGIALLAGVAGMISISTAKSGALIGVLISVTTIPAAANVGVAAAYRDWAECGGAAAQLVINLAAILAAALATLGVQRLAYVRRALQA